VKLPRRKFLHLAAGAAALAAAPRVVRAQAYPTRPVHMIVGLPAGGGADIVARMLGQWLSERLGQQFVVEDRPGAGSNIATEAVVRALPDGYTLLLATSSNTLGTTLYPDADFNFNRDIAPVAMIGTLPFVMAVNPMVPATSLPEFIAYAKANPGKINYASRGSGTITQVVGELFKMMAGVNLVHVPYRGDFTTDLLSGRVQVAFYAIADSAQYIRDGKLRALAVTSARRAGALPDIPDMGEFLPGYEASGWLGVGAPKSTSSEVIDKLNREIVAFGADPDMKARLVGLGLEPMSFTPDEFRKFIADETVKWAKVVKFAGIKAE
jgi:tripartite-type tricarboxylate transporter receptor subunit TctC